MTKGDVCQVNSLYEREWVKRATRGEAMRKYGNNVLLIGIVWVYLRTAVWVGNNFKKVGREVGGMWKRALLGGEKWEEQETREKVA